MSSQPDDASLVAAAVAGDTGAFALLYRRCRDDVWRMSCYMLRDEHAAEEATQDTFVKAWERLARYRATGTLRSWVLSICRNVCIDRLRDESRIRKSLDRVAEAWPERSGGAQTADPVRGIALRIALRELHHDECEAWFLVDVLGYRSDEAARVAGVRAASTMRSRVTRARDRLALALVSEPSTIEVGGAPAEAAAGSLR